MTILLHPTLPLSHLSFVTISAAIAVVRAIEQTAGFTPQIKWVNDADERTQAVRYLTEATIEGETGTVSSLVVGIGINLHPNPAWPEEVQAVAGAISDFGKPPRRAELAAAVLNHFEDVYALLDQGKEPELLEQYRERLCCIDRPVTVISPAGRYEAECVGLDENAHLLVKTADGQVNALSSGEISIRL
ncbi:MAG: biotin--[acetyl-CoA-carboxylase] ligase [Butyricicoccus sp.]